MLNLCFTKCKNSFYRPCIQFHRMTIIMQIIFNAKIASNSSALPSCSAITWRSYETNKTFGWYREMQNSQRSDVLQKPLGSDPGAQMPAVLLVTVAHHPSEPLVRIPGRGHCSTPRSAGLRMEGALHAGQLLLVSLSPSSCDSCSLFALTVHRVPCPTRGKWWPNEHSYILKRVLCGQHHLKSPFADQPVVFCPLMTHYHFWMCAVSPLPTSIVHVKNVLPCPAEELWEVTVWWICHLDTDWAAFRESKWGLSQGSLYRASVLIMWKQFRFAENQTASVVNVRCRTQKNALYPNKWLKSWKWISLLSFLRSICRKQF